MSIRPVDMQASVPRSHEVNRTGSQDASRSDLQNQQFGAKLEKEIQHEQQSVKNTDKTEQNSIDKDGSNKNNPSKKKKKQEPKKTPAAKALESYKSLGGLDVKI